ncbi:DNA-directed RNA polymerase II subunit GRINL1A [Lemmus lemmus]
MCTGPLHTKCLHKLELKDGALKVFSCGLKKLRSSGKMATPAGAPESPLATEPAPAVGPAAEPCPPRQPVHNVLAVRGFEPPAPAELRERLRRQERRLHNEKFICKLPNKGKKIADTIAKLKAAIAEHEEVRARTELFHPISVDCKLRQKAATRVDTDVDKTQNSDLMLDISSLVLDCSSADKSPRTTSETQGPVHLTPKGNEETLEADCTVNPGKLPAAKPGNPHLKLMNISPNALFQVKRKTFPVALTSDSPSHCQRGESPASSEEQRRRARQHLDDITAARLLLLHHLPAQPLSIEESLALQKEQKQNYEEMQTKLAAQKSAERLNIKMKSYNPEGESSGRYREVRDEDDAQS